MSSEWCQVFLVVLVLIGIIQVVSVTTMYHHQDRQITELCRNIDRLISEQRMYRENVLERSNEVAHQIHAALGDILVFLSRKEGVK